MKVISWNLNARSSEQTLNDQCNYLKLGNYDFITLQEVTLKSEIFIKEFFKDLNCISSFDLASDHNILIKKRKYGQLIISPHKLQSIDTKKIEIPFPERVLGVKVVENYKNIEIYTTHVPPGSSNGIIKVQHYEGLFKFLKSNKSKKILSGDFNSPKEERGSGEIITWGQKINKKGEVRLGINSKWRKDCDPERWDAAERNIIQNHNQLGMIDAFRSFNDYSLQSYSWFLHGNDKNLGRRYDHIFCSDTFKPISCFYDQKPRQNKLSDHSPIIAEIN